MVDVTSKLKALKKTNSFLKDALKKCVICPRRCGVDRSGGKTGYCRAALDPIVYSYTPHHGEEPPISAKKGSGTVFFSHCNMKCVYCQNYHFSQLDKGRAVSLEKLAKMMLSLQNTGCHNINLVSPTHFVPQILSALEIAFELGLNIPIVYNTSGYELPETIALLKGIVDIYLADMRYSDDAAAKKYSDAKDYVKYNRASIKTMHDQVGDLIVDKDGLAVKGMIVRLLVMPYDISGTIKTLRFIRDEVSKETFLSIMSQYHPTFKASEHKKLSNGITHEEYKNIVDEAHLLGLNNGWIQDMGALSGEPGFLGTKIPPRTEI